MSSVSRLSLCEAPLVEPSTLPLRQEVIAFSTHVQYFGEPFSSSWSSLTPFFLKACSQPTDDDHPTPLSRWTSAGLFDLNILRHILNFTLPVVIPSTLPVVETMVHPSTRLDEDLSDIVDRNDGSGLPIDLESDIWDIYALRPDGTVFELGRKLAYIEHFFFRYRTVGDSNVVIAPVAEHSEIVTIAEDETVSFTDVLAPSGHELYTMACNSHHMVVVLSVGSVTLLNPKEEMPKLVAFVGPLGKAPTHGFPLPPLEESFDIVLHPHLDLLMITETHEVMVLNFQGQLILRIARQPTNDSAAMGEACFSLRHEAILVCNGPTTKLIVPFNTHAPYEVKVTRPNIPEECVLRHHILNGGRHFVESWSDEDAETITTCRYRL